MDTNAEILIELTQLRGLSTAFSGGDRIRCSLASTLDAMVETITLSNNILYDITSYRERKRREYTDGLSYNAIKKLQITKVTSTKARIFPRRFSTFLTFW